MFPVWCFVAGESVTRSCGLRVSDDFVLIASNTLGTGEFDQAEGASLRFTREAVRATRSVSILCWLKLHSFSGAPHKWRDASEARGLTGECCQRAGKVCLAASRLLDKEPTLVLVESLGRSLAIPSAGCARVMSMG